VTQGHPKFGTFPKGLKDLGKKEKGKFYWGKEGLKEKKKNCRSMQRRVGPFSGEKYLLVLERLGSKPGGS